MFLAHEGEQLKAALDHLNDEAAETQRQARELERAWKEGDRPWLVRCGYLKPFHCEACGATGDQHIRDIAVDSTTGEEFALCRCGHDP